MKEKYYNKVIWTELMDKMSEEINCKKCGIILMEKNKKKGLCSYCKIQKKGKVK